MHRPGWMQNEHFRIQQALFLELKEKFDLMLSSSLGTINPA